MIRIFNHYVSLTILFIAFGDFLILTGTFLGIQSIGDGSQSLSRSIGSIAGTPSILLASLITGILGILSLFISGLYDFTHFTDSKEFKIRLAVAILMIFFFTEIIHILFSPPHPKKYLHIIAVFISILILAAWRTAAVNFRFKGSTEQVLFLGNAHIAKILSEINLQRNNVAVVKILSQDELSDFDLADFISKNTVHRIVVAMNDRRGKLDIPRLLHCKMSGIKVCEWGTFYEIHANKIDIMSINPSFLIFGEGFRQPKVLRLIKRVLDSLLALVVLILTIPLFIIVAIAVKLESPGPIFYSQERVGRYNKPFHIYKFRSMVTDAEKGNSPVWAKKNDSRITRVGQFIRKTRLDELPQLWNILKGEMSFVGPRPERPVFVKELEEKIPFYSQRHIVKPGLTGWAQIRYEYGASIEDALKKLEYDLYYVKNMSIFLDIMTIMETVHVVLFRKGSR